jgi:hypothetical protein
VAAFVTAMHADPRRARLYAQAPSSIEREWEYWLHIGVPGESATTRLLSFSVIVNRVEASGEPGYLAIYRPTGDTIPLVKQVYEQMVQSGGLGSYVRYQGGASQSYPHYWPMIRQDRLWWIRGENAAHRLLWSQPSVGLHLLDFYFAPARRSRLGQWEEAVLRALRYFHVLTAGARREEHPAHAAYQEVLSHLAQYAEFPRLYQRAVVDILPLALPEHETAEFHACDQSIRCRMLDGLWLHFRCMVCWERTPQAVGMEPDLYRQTLVPADPVTHAALILLDLDRALPAAPAENPAPETQLIWGIALVQTALAGLTSAEADADWTPLGAFEQVITSCRVQEAQAPLTKLEQQFSALLAQLPTRSNTGDAHLTVLVAKIASRKGYSALVPLLETTAAIKSGAA